MSNLLRMLFGAGTLYLYYISYVNFETINYAYIYFARFTCGETDEWTGTCRQFLANFQRKNEAWEISSELQDMYQFCSTIAENAAQHDQKTRWVKGIIFSIWKLHLFYIFLKEMYPNIAIWKFKKVNKVMPSLNPCSSIGKPSSNVEAEEGRPLLFPPNYYTSIMIIKTIWRAMLVILDLIGIIILTIPTCYKIY